MNGRKDVTADHYAVRYDKEPNIIIEHIKKSLEGNYGKGKYSLIDKNCEHFANLIIHGIPFSGQSDDDMARGIYSDPYSFEFIKDEDQEEPSIRSWIEQILTVKSLYFKYLDKDKADKRIDEQIFDNLPKARELTKEEKTILIQLENKIAQEKLKEQISQVEIPPK